MTLNQLENWIKVFLITDQELGPLPSKLVNELLRPLRERWIRINIVYYNAKRT